MTVSSEVNYIEYNGDGSTTTFAIPFYFILNTDISVQIADADANITNLTYGIDYTISGAGNASGGSGTLNTAYASGYTILFFRNPPATQETAYYENGKFPAKSHEKALDKLTMLVQGLITNLGLALRKPSFLANYYDALNNRIRNLRDPEKDHDAATKNYVDSADSNLEQQITGNFNRSLRVPEASISQLPSVHDRAWMGLGFDGSGNPKLQDPAGTGLWGYVPAGGSFEIGGTLSQRFEVLLWESTGEYWRWDGPMPKIVLPGSTPTTAGGTGKGKWVDVTDATLRSDLGSSKLPGADIVMTSLGVTVEKSTIQVDTIASLKNLFPQGSDRVYTKGAFSAGDGGADSWVFILTDQSANVAAYPKLFIPPASDPTGASGAWFINTGKAINAVSFGLGCTTDVTINDAIVNQLIAYNKGKNDIILPAKTIFSKQVVGEYSPNFKGVKGATANETGGNGTVFIFKNADSTDSCMKFQRASGFITGFFMEGFTMVGYDAFNGVTIDTFGPRTNRKGLDLKYIGGKIKVDEIFIIGISEALHVDRLQDGKLSGVSMLYCSNADGTVPAAWISTSDGTNTNYMHFEDMHVEFSPFMLFLGYSRHNKFNHCKFESQRKVDATHYSVYIDASAFENAFDSTMFVTTATTLRHFMLDRGTNITSDMTYPGIRWYYRNTVSVNPNNTISNCKFTRVLPADGSDPLEYPIVLGNYQKFSGRVNVDKTVTYAGGTVDLVNSGLISLGNNAIIDSLTFSTNTNPKVAGPVL
ncbi:TPA: hypothetical protein ACQ3B3_000369 [Klebsiella pneumoniae]